jgi:hypothetical protein
MRNNHDPLVPHQRRKTARETPDEAEQRLNADLRALMNDERYRKNDGDYRHYVQRQYRRVYDDPTGARPKHLTIGRPNTYASDLEPFDRRREQLLRRQTEAGEPEGGKARPVVAERSPTNDGRIRRMQNASGDNGGTAQEEHDISPPWDRAIGKLDPEPRRRSTPFPGIRDVEDEGAQERYQDYLSKKRRGERQIPEALLRSWGFVYFEDLVGHDEAARAYRHYLEGSGEPLTVNAEIVRDYGPVKDAEGKVLGYLTEWFTGKRTDSQFGRPWFGMDDGERIVVGNMSADPNDVGRLVQWEAGFAAPSETYHPSDQTSEARRTFNAGTLESYSQLVLERHGDKIEVSGFVIFRVYDRYDFKPGHRLKAKILEDYGDAQSYDISTTFWVRPISGWIDITGSLAQRAHVSFDD